MCCGSVVARKHACVRCVLSGWGGNQSLLSFVLFCLSFLVLLVLRHCASICPMAMASNDGGNLVSVASLSPENGGRKPLRNAVRSVEMAGENRAAWANATRSAGVLECQFITGAAKWSVFSSGGATQLACAVWLARFMFLGRIHRPCLL